MIGNGVPQSALRGSPFAVPPGSVTAEALREAQTRAETAKTPATGQRPGARPPTAWRLTTVLKATARLLVPLLRILLPPGGRHRLDELRPAVQSPPEPRVPALSGEAIGIVRPYLIAYERRQEARWQHARCRALWLAVHGVDTGPGLIHGVKVVGRA